MNCPECGASISAQPISKGVNGLNSVVKKATENKLKSIRPKRTRPDDIKGKGGMTRGGRYAGD